MPTIADIQASFAAGELSPYLYGRVDLAKFHVGARIIENFFVHAQGGISNRAGTAFTGEVDDHTYRHRLLPFRFRSSPSGQTYALVFGHLTMQVVKDGGFVESSPGTIYTLATPYTAEDLALLKIVQSNDTVTLTHPSYSTRRLTRTGHANWSLSIVTFLPSTNPPTGLTAGAAGTSGYVKVTAINDSTGEESLPTAEVGASSATAGVWSWTATSNCTNYNVYKKKGSIYGFVAQVQEATWTDSNIDPDIGNTPPGTRNPFGTLTLSSATVTNGGSGYTAPTGEVIDAGRVITTVTFGLTGTVITSATLAATGQNVSANAYVSITEAGGGSGAVLSPEFADVGDGSGNVYLSAVTVVDGGASYSATPTVKFYLYGVPDYFPYILTATVMAGAITSVAITGAYPFPSENQSQVALIATDTDTGSGAVITLNTGSTPDSGSRNPGCSTYYQQRQVYGNTTALPLSLWFTVVGAFGNMNVSTPTRDSDAITRALASREVNEIRHLVPIGTNMLVMTSGAEWRCWPGPASNALTPAACFTLPQTFFGCNQVPPLTIGNSVLFVQERGSRVRELQFDVLQDQYKPTDMTVLAQHLLLDNGANYSIDEWAFAEEPWRVVWAVRSDGTLLGFTYMREQEVYAWHRHITDGEVESVCSIPETENGVLIDAVYLIVKRTIGGETKRYVERMASRTFDDIADAWFVDCGLQYDGAPVDTVSGLDHIEGKAVAILADGNVIEGKVVTGGAVTLDAEYSKITVGLPFTATLESLNWEIHGVGNTTQNQMKKVSQIGVRVKDSRGLKLGLAQTSRVSGAATAPKMVEVKQRTSAPDLGTALPMFNGDYQVTLPTEWNKTGRIVARQDYPLPATILDLIPEIAPGD